MTRIPMRVPGRLVAAIACLAAGCLGCPRKAADQIHLIGEGFTGTVVVAYGVRGGARLSQDENGAMVYNIPPSGQLVLSSEAPQDGFSRKTYLILLPDGSRRALPYQSGPDDFQVFGNVHGTAGSTQSGEPVLSYTAYFVGVPNQTPDWAVRRDRAVDQAVAQIRNSQREPH